MRDVGQQCAFTRKEIPGDTLDCRDDHIARARRRKVRCDRPHQHHERLAPVAVAADDFKFAPAQRRAHGRRLARARHDQFGDEARFGLEEMDVGVPQRVVGIEDEMKRASVAERFVPARPMRTLDSARGGLSRTISGRRV